MHFFAEGILCCSSRAALIESNSAPNALNVRKKFRAFSEYFFLLLLFYFILSTEIYIIKYMQHTASIKYDYTKEIIE